ncbi:hypothetical protein LguiB_021654 [Lonicera macranthoides]
MEVEETVNAQLETIDEEQEVSWEENGRAQVVEAEQKIEKVKIGNSGSRVRFDSVGIGILYAAIFTFHGVWFCILLEQKLQKLSKKTKRIPKVEAGKRTTNASVDRSLKGTAYSEIMSKKK